MVTQLPITVSLATPTVVVTQGGPPVSVQIIIKSTSETALVAIIGLPAGLQEKYVRGKPVVIRHLVVGEPIVLA